METQEKITAIDRVLDYLNRMTVSGIRNSGMVYAAAGELERLRFVLKQEADEEAACAAGDDESEAEE